MDNMDYYSKVYNIIEVNFMNMDKIISFFMSNEVKTFIVEYATSKTLDGVLAKITKSKDLSVGEQLISALSESLERLCREMKWEYDEKAIPETFIYSISDVKSLSKKEQLKKILQASIGQTIDEEILDIWAQFFEETISANKYQKIYNIYLLNSIQETNIKLLNINNDITDIKQYINNSQPKDLFNDDYIYALNQVKVGKFETAIDTFMRIKSSSDGVKNKKITYDIGFYFLKWAELSNNDEAILINAIEYLREATQFSDKYDEDDDYLIFRNLARAYENLASHKNKLENYKNAEKYILKAIDIAKNIDNNIYDLYLLNLDLARINECLSAASSISDAKVYLEKAVEIYKNFVTSEMELPEEQLFVLYHNIARMLEKKAELNADYGVLDSAIEYYIQADNIPFASIEKNPAQYALVHNNLGNIFYLKDTISSIDSIKDNLEDSNEWIEESLRHYKLALDVYSLEKNKNEYLRTLTNIARVHSRLYKKYKRDDDFIKSKNIFEDVLKYRKPINDPIGCIIARIGIADLFINRINIYNIDKKNGKLESVHELLSEAKSYCKDSLDICKKDKNEKMYCNIMIIYGQVLTAEAGLNNNFPCYQNALRLYQDVLKICNSHNNLHMFIVAIERLIYCMVKASECINNNEEEYMWYLNQIKYIENINAEKYAIEIYYNTSSILWNLYNQKGQANYLIMARDILNNYKNKVGNVLNENELEELDIRLDEICELIRINSNS